jgi:phosphomannomutase
MGGVTAVPVYRELGVEMTELFTEPDSSFPTSSPRSDSHRKSVDVIAAVHGNNADIGIAFDGDGDRIGVVDENGRIFGAMN